MDNQKKSSVLISIVTYKAEDYVKKCLNALNWTIRYKNIYISIIDNSPTNSIEKYVDSSGLDAAYHFTGDNMGFGKGHNFALQKFIDQHGFPPDLILILNPDLILKEKPYRLMLTAILDDPTLAIVGPKLYSKEGHVERSAFTDPNAIEYLSGFISKLLVPRIDIYTGLIAPKKTSFVKGLSGACLLIKREAIKNNVIFDPKYFMYFEDLDLCKRVSKDGWKIKYIEEARAVHSRGASSEGKKDRDLWLKRMMYESLSLYFKKNKGMINIFILWTTFSLVLKIKSMLGIDKKWARETAISIDKIFQGKS